MSAEIKPEQLEAFEILRGLTAKEREVLVPLLKLETYPTGRVIFREGDPGNKLYLVLRGVVQIEKGVDEANYTRLARLGQGEMLGEISILDKSPRTATATAYLDTELLVLLRSQLDTLTTDQPAIGAKLFLGMAQSLARRLRFADDEITQLTKRLYYF
ncbi:cyclic nucleotide-binding domain-containing protein [bacterium]|nr:cyclic nucleotide-binding domain-containing protein [bacterium]